MFKPAQRTMLIQSTLVAWMALAGLLSHVYFGLTSMRFVEEYSFLW
jgi:hypothetical protein